MVGSRRFLSAGKCDVRNGYDESGELFAFEIVPPHNQIDFGIRSWPLLGRGILTLPGYRQIVAQIGGPQPSVAASAAPFDHASASAGNLDIDHASRFGLFDLGDARGGDALAGRLATLQDPVRGSAAFAPILAFEGSGPAAGAGNDTGNALHVNPFAANVAPSFFAAGSAVTRVSTDSAGGQATGGASESPVFSPDGSMIAFVSRGTNLVPGDTNGWKDIFLKNLTTGAITRVSTDSAGGEADRESISPVFSPDGSKIAFGSNAGNLVAGDTNNADDIFVKDLSTGAIVRVSTDSTGAQANGSSLAPIFSPDGTKVAFYSDADNLVAGDTNGRSDIFVKDLVTGAITRVSTDAAGGQVAGSSIKPAFSPDGSKIAFESDAANLVAGDTNNRTDIFIKDLATGAITRLSTDSAGAEGSGGHSTGAVFSPDGTKVAFTSGATNLVAGDTNNLLDVFVKDWATGAIMRVSTDSAGAQATGGDSLGPAFSPDGSRIAFQSSAGNLVVPDINGGADVYIKDLNSGVITRVSTNAAGGQVSANNGDYQVTFSPDSLTVAFSTSATNVVPGDTNSQVDIFVKQIGLPPPTFVENDPPIIPAVAVALSDADSDAYAGGTFSAVITAGATAGDLLSIASGGDGITIVGNSVRYHNIEFGILTATSTSLSVALDADATDAAVKALAEAVRFVSTSDNPTNATRTITYTIVDGGGTAGGGADSASFNVNVAVTAVDDQVVAVADNYTTTDTVVLDVDAAHGVFANDPDPDGGPNHIQIWSGGFNTPATYTMPSGARVTLNPDGSFRYDPAGKLSYLISPEAAAATGAVNTSLVESFYYAYKFNGANHAFVTMTVNGLDGVGDQLWGDGSNNTITDTVGADYFNLSQGGNDTAYGFDGDDGFYFGAAFTAADFVDGGAGANDQIGLEGNYAGANALVLGPNTIANIEALVVLTGFSYNITTNDGNVAAGALLKVQATQLHASESLTFNGSAEHDGSFIVYGGQGIDNFTGGDGNDGFYFGPGGFNANDTVNGGPGSNDRLGLDGNYGSGAGAPFVLGSNVTNVEVVVLLPGPINVIYLSTTDAFVPAGQTMTIFGLQAAGAFTFSGSNEHDGAFNIYGSTKGDTITGSDGADWLFGGGGGDMLTGAAGADTFYYDDVGQSAGTAFDKIVGFDDSADKIDLPFAVTGFASPASGSLNNASFSSDLTTAFAGLTTHQAGVFTATGGDMNGRTFLVVDADGTAGYQAGSDYVIEIVSPATPVDNPAIFV
jgi:Tol biopolymer transport system component